MKKINPIINDANTLPGDFYCSSDYFLKTKNDLFPNTWQLIGSPDVLNISSSAYPFTFLEGFVDEPLVFVNNKNGELNCFSNTSQILVPAASLTNLTTLFSVTL